MTTQSYSEFVINYDLSKVDRKLDTIKVCTASINSSSTLLYCSIIAMYNRFHRDQIKHLTLKSYLTGMNTSNFPKKNDENILDEKLVNQLHAWI